MLNTSVLKTFARPAFESLSRSSVWALVQQSLDGRGIATAAAVPAPPAEYADRLTFIRPDEAAPILRNKSDGVLVLDVRDITSGGHIKGSYNAVSGVHFKDAAAIDAMIDNRLTSLRQVFVHCQLSQHKGPAAALKLVNRLKERQLVTPNVAVLQGGFAGFAAQFGTDTDLVEEFVAKAGPLKH